MNLDYFEEREVYERIQQSNFFTFFDDIEVFNTFFDFVDLDEELKKKTLEKSFFMVIKKNNSLIRTKINPINEIKEKFNIDMDYIEKKDIFLNYKKPTVLYNGEYYYIYGLKDFEISKYNIDKYIEKELLIKIKDCHYDNEENNDLFLCLLKPFEEMYNLNIKYKKIFYIDNIILNYFFGTNKNVEIKNLDDLYKFMILNDISNLDLNGNGQKYALISEKHKRKKVIQYLPSNLVEEDIIYKIKKETNEDEYNEFKEVKKAMRVIFNNKRRDFRISIKKSKMSYRISLRLLATEEKISNLEGLNYSKTPLKVFKEIVHKEVGLQKSMPAVIIAGATGEGKSTLAYGLIKALLENERLVTEVGNPIEILLTNDYICQYDLGDTENAEANQRDTLVGLLSVCKRQNPDIIYLTEVRDAEEKREVFAHIAQGFGIIFTMHTHNAWKTLEDLKTSLGPENENKIGESLSTTINQKLIPSLCTKCKGTGVLNHSICPQCNGSKKYGVVPIVEIWKRRKIKDKPLPKLTKENYNSKEVVELFFSYEDSIEEQLQEGKIDEEIANIEKQKLI